MKKINLLSSKIKVVLISLLFIFIFFEIFLNLFSFFTVDDRLNRSRQDLPEIMCFGDSFVYGIGVDKGEDYPSVMDSILKGYDVLNMGKPSINSSIVLSRIKKALKDNSPDIITVQVGLNNYWNKQEISEKEDKKDTSSLKDYLFKVKTFRFFYIVYNTIFKELSNRFTPSEFKYIKRYPPAVVNKDITNTFDKIYTEYLDFNKEVDFIAALNNNKDLTADEKTALNRWIESLKEKGDIIPVKQDPDSVELMTCIDNRIRNNMYKEALELSFQKDDDVCYFLYRGFLYYLLKENELAQEWFKYALSCDKNKKFSEYFYSMFLLNTGRFKELLDFKKSIDTDVELFKSFSLLEKYRAPVNENDTSDIVVPPFAGRDIYLNFYRLNHIMLYRHKIKKTDLTVIKGFLYNLFLESEYYTIQKYMTLGNPWVFSRIYQDFIDDVEKDIIHSPKIWRDDETIREYVFCFLLKKISKLENEEFSEKLRLFRLLYSEYKERKSVSDKLLSLFYTLNADDDNDIIKMKKIIELFKKKSSDPNARKDFFESKCFLLFSQIHNGTLSLSKSLDALSKEAISLYDEELFYRYRSEALKTLVMTRKFNDIEEVLSFHDQAIKRFGIFDFYSNLGIIYRYLYIDTEKKEYLERSIYNLEKAIELKYDEGLLNLIVLNLGLEGKRKRISDVLSKFPQASEKYDVNTILSLSKGRSMSPKLFDPNTERFELRFYKHDERLLKDLKEIKQICDERKIKLVFLNYLQSRIPEMSILKKQQPDTNFFNIYEKFGKENRRLKYSIKEIFLSDGHLTPLGNKYVAKNLIDFLRKNALLPASDKVKDF